MQQTLEGASEFDVEDGIDDRIEEAVDVAEPDEEGQQDGIDATDGERVEQVVAEADRVDDVQREKRNPAQQKHTCAKEDHTVVTLLTFSPSPGRLEQSPLHIRSAPASTFKNRLKTPFFLTFLLH